MMIMIYSTRPVSATVYKLTSPRLVSFQALLYWPNRLNVYPMVRRIIFESLSHKKDHIFVNKAVDGLGEVLCIMIVERVKIKI